MHLLAHALCGAREEGLLVGQVAGDFVRGRDLSAFPASIARGIRQHRQLDSYSDQHPIAQCSRSRLHGEWRRYAGVLVDLAYGHALAANWRRHVGEPALNGFVERVHEVLARHHHALPDRLKRAREPLRANRVLSGIGDEDGVAHACDRLAYRLPALRGAEAVVLREYDSLMADFDAFWPALTAYNLELD
ncbi:MAG: ACP phosphodiesterase [Pseudomonadota bacterium]